MHLYEFKEIDLDKQTLVKGIQDNCSVVQQTIVY